MTVNNLPEQDELDHADIAARSRGRKERAGEEGERLPATDYTSDGDANFLGVDEPVVSPAERGEAPPDPPLHNLNPQRHNR
jgi:hypothetical protein